MAAKDQFAEKSHAKIYSSYRRDTPAAVIEKIISVLKEKYDGPLDVAVDAGCGSGQSACALAPFFKRVHGMDVSEAQIQEAKDTRALPNVTYEVAPAETIAFDDGSIQLVSAGASLHWFQMDLFFTEVRRVLCNNGILAVYCYYKILPELDDPAKDEEVLGLYDEFYSVTKNYYAPQVAIAMNKYEDISFPFEDVQKIRLRETFDGELKDIVGYVSTYSAFQNLKREDEKNAMDFLENFGRRLKEIVTECKKNPDGRMKLHRDFFLIMCRKMV